MRSVPFHYGWVILVAGGIGAFMTLQGQTNGVALFFDPLAADLGLTRAQVALAYTVGTLAGILPAPLVGRWIDRRGPRLAAGAIHGGRSSGLRAVREGFRRASRPC